MGLLSKAEKARNEKVKKLSKANKKYVNHISPARKKILHSGIKQQRKAIVKKTKLKVPEIKNRKGLKEGEKVLVDISGIKKGLIKKSELLQKKSLSVPKPKKKETLALDSTSQKEITSMKGKKDTKKKLGFDISSIKESIRQKLEGVHKKKGLTASEKKNRVYTSIPGFDSMLSDGIPKGSSILVAGGAGSGKTIFGLQTLINHCEHGEKCLYMSFEESEEKLITHMEEFGWNPKKYIKKKLLLIQRFNPFDITRSVDALLLKAKGELMIDVQPIILPGNFKPDFIVVDSLTAISSAFTKKEDSYRIYIEQLFRFFEKINATSFLITETEQVPKIFSTTGVEEFLADGVIVIYNIKRGNIRERAIEILKLRGAQHQHKIVAMNITTDGIEVFPEQEIFGGIGGEE